MTGSSLAGATQDEVRRHNLGSLLRLLHESGSMSRSDLATSTGLNRSTIGALTVELAEAGLVRESDPVGRGVGRPSIVVTPNSAGAFVIAVDIGVEHVTVALVGLGGEVLARRDLIQRGAESAPALARRVARMVRTLEASAPRGSTCVGVGVGVPGVVRQPDGLVEVAPNLQWFGAPLGEVMATALRTSLPITVANDADLAAMAEHVRGAAVGYSHVVHINGDVGLGGGVIVDGVLLSGAGGYAGEFGHMMVDPGGRACRCGSSGCWETTIGESAVLDALGAGQEQGWRTAVVDTPDVRVALQPIGRWMGVGLRNLVNIFNPQVVVFGGMYARTYPLVSDEVITVMAPGLAAPMNQVHICTTALGNDSVLIGAAESAFAPLLADPLGHLARARAEHVA